MSRLRNVDGSGKIMLVLPFLLFFIYFNVECVADEDLKSTLELFNTENKVTKLTELNFVWSCTSAVNMLEENKCAAVELAFEQVSGRVGHLAFSKLDYYNRTSLNFVFDDSTKEIEEKFAETNTFFNIEEIDFGCKAINFFPNANHYMLFYLSREVDVGMCANKSALYYLGFKNLSMLSNEGQLKDVFQSLVLGD